MNERFSIQSVEVLDLRFHGEVFEVETEDGPVIRTPRGLGVRAKLLDGSRFWHQRTFSNTDEGCDRARKFADRILDHGSIDLDYWFPTFPEYGSVAYFEEVDLANSYARSNRLHDIGGHYLESLV